MAYAASASETGRSFTRGAATLAASAGILGLVDFVALHFARPDLAPGGHVLSEYAIGYAPLGIASFALQTISCLGLAAALAGVATTIGLRIGAALMALAGLGLGLAIAFPMDPLDTPAGQETFAGTMHGVSAMVGIPSIIAACLVLAYALRKRVQWAGVRGWLVGLAHLSWIGLASMIACMILLLAMQVTIAGDIVGWGNRLLVVSYSLFVIIAAWPLAKSNR
jgi:hypothetical protein